MSTEDTDAERISAMWRDLANTLREWIPSLLEEGTLDKASEALIVATMAEACYWQADGEFTEPVKMKDVVQFVSNEP